MKKIMRCAKRRGFLTASVSFYGAILLIILSASGCATIQTGAGVRKIAMNAAAPVSGFADIVIKASVEKPAIKWKNQKYLFTFIVSKERFEIESEPKPLPDTEKIGFAAEVRVRAPANKRTTVMFDSPEKLRRFVAEVFLESGAIHKLEFNPVYKGNTVTYAARFDGEEIPLRYERFNIH